MTIVELCDNNSLKNIISSFMLHPEKVIVIGDNKELKKLQPFYTKLLAEFGCPTEVEVRSTVTTDLNAIVDTLCDIVQTEEDCVFDLTGGGDLLLTAMGIVYERYRETGRIRMHRFNIRKGTAKDMISGKTLKDYPLPMFSVSQNVRVYGGRIGGSTTGGELADWDFSPAFTQQLDTMWCICTDYLGTWNYALTGLYEFLGEDGRAAMAQTVDVDLSALDPNIVKLEDKEKAIRFILRQLEEQELVRILDVHGHIAFTCDNLQVRRLLCTAGTLLEAQTLRYMRGLDMFNDSMNGVFIDWDGEFHEREDNCYDAVNEIDVLAMKGLVPYFISCKNGKVGSDELYKLETVASRFGGEFAVKVLVCTYISNDEETRADLLERAKNMGIHVVSGVHELSADDFVKQLRMVFSQ